MKRTPILTLVALAAIFFVSCKNSASDLPIPKDAGIVVHIDATSLASKLKWEDIKATEFFKDGTQHENDSMAKKLMENPEASGIDIKSDFVLFVKKQGKANLIVFEGRLKDANAFESVVKYKDRTAKVEKDGDLSYIQKDDNSLISWTSSKFFITVYAQEQGYITGETGEGNWQRSEVSAKDSLKKYTKELLALKKDNSLESDDRFTALLKEKGDAHFWVSMENYSADMGNMIQDEALSSLIFGMQDLFKGNISTGTLSFDDGKITMKAKQYMGDQMKKIMDKYELKPVTTALVNRIPSDNAVAAFVGNYPPELSMEMLKATGLAPVANGFLKKYNYSLEELMGATKGEFILALTNFSFDKTVKTIPESGYSYPTIEPNIEALFALSVSNKASLDKLIGIAESQIDSAARAIIFSRISYKTTNDWFALSSSPQTADRFLAGGNNKVAFAEKISGHPLGMYIDIQKMIKASQPVFTDNSAELNTSTNMWQDIVMTGGDYKNGVSTSEFTINLVNKSTNSLKQLNQYFESLYRAQKKRRDDMMREYDNNNDSTAAPVIEAPSN